MNNQNKHTPGPWQDFVNDDGELIVQMGKSHRVFVADMEGSCSHCHANARLIAAAPELLQACEAALKLADEMNEGDLYDQIKSAIAKAKGEQ
jgi:hypothetical protein